MKKDFIDGLKSGFSFIVINTVEVTRVTDVIKKYVKEWNEEVRKSKNAPGAVKEHGYSLKIWDTVTGLYKYDLLKDKVVETYKNTTEAPKAIQAVAEDHASHMSNPEKEPAGVYVYQNLHLQWDDPMMRQFIVQDIINLSADRLPHRHLVFVGPYSQIPIEIAHLLVPLEFSLPTKAELVDLTKKFDLTFSRHKAKLEDEDRVAAAEAAAGMTEYEAENAFRFAIISSQGKELPASVIQEKKAEAVRKTGLLEYQKVAITKEDIGGMHNMVRALDDLSYLYHNKTKAKEYGVPMPKGWLITGISGTGKSLIAKGISNIFGVPLFLCDLGKVFGSLVGETEKNTLQLLKQIEAVSPAVILLDEIEKALSGLESSGQSDAGVTSRLIGRLLTFMQEKKDESFFCATANSVSTLPPELLRKGRFNQIWFVDLPIASEREHILKIHIKKVGRKWEDYDLKLLVKESEGCTGAEIEGFISDAMYHAFPLGREFNTTDILECMKATPFLSKTKEQEIKDLREWANGRARIANLESDEDRRVWAGHWSADSTIISE